MAIPFDIVITDLDGTLLDEASYDVLPARPALARLRGLGIPVVFCTSKTLAETVHIQESLSVRDPFIVENGGAVYFRPGQLRGGPLPVQRTGNWERFSLGIPYIRLAAALRDLGDQAGLALRGFADLSILEVAQACGLSLEAAARAKDRQYDEPFQVQSEDGAGYTRLESLAHADGLRIHRGGRFHHLSGPHDKGQAVTVLLAALHTPARGIRSVGIGDSPNDLPMLERVDQPVVVQRPTGTWDPFLLSRLPAAYRAEGVGPAGWNAAVLDLLGHI